MREGGMHEAGRADLPGSSPKRRQTTIREHMKDPRIRLDKHAAAMDEDAVTRNLFALSSGKLCDGK